MMDDDDDDNEINTNKMDSQRTPNVCMPGCCTLSHYHGKDLSRFARAATSGTLPYTLVHMFALLSVSHI
jgi:hypothetical protein